MLQAFYFFFNASLGIIYSFLPVYLKSLGYDGGAVANIMAIDPIIGILGVSIFWGWVADRTQRPATLLKFLALGVAISFIPVLTGQYWLIFVGYIIFGLSCNPIGGLSDSLALVKAKEKGIDFGKIRVWASAGWLSATILIGFVLALRGMDVKIQALDDVLTVLGAVFEGKNINWGDPVVIYIIIGGFALTFLTALGFKDRKYDKKDNNKITLADFKLILKNKYFLVFLFSVIFHIISLRSFYFLFGMHVQALNMSPTILSIAFAAGTLAEMGAFYFFGKLKKILSLEVLIALAAALSVVRWVGIANAETSTSLILIQLLHAASSGIFLAAAANLIESTAEGKLLVTYQQVYYYVMALSNLIGTYFSGYAFDFFGGNAAPVFYTVSVLELFTVVTILVAQVIRKKKTIVTAAP
jgi:PPP family 3-phenylpropionic acid transporter